MSSKTLYHWQRQNNFSSKIELEQLFKEFFTEHLFKKTFFEKVGQ